MATPRARRVPSSAAKDPASNRPIALPPPLQQCQMARTVLQQRKTQFIGILGSGIRHLVEEGLREKVVHRMADRAPEADDRGIVDMDLGNPLVGDCIDLAAMPSTAELSTLSG